MSIKLNVSLWTILSPFQKAAFQDVVHSLAQCKRDLDQSAHDTSPSSDDWWKYCLLLGKPGTRKSQVVVRAFHHAIQQECAVLLATPVALQSHLWPRSTCQEHSHGFPNSIWPGAGSRHQLCPQPFRHGGPWWGIPHLTAYLLLGGQHSKSSELLSCCADSWGQAISSNHCRRWTAGSPTPCPSSMMAPSTTTTPWSTPYTSSSECSIQTTAPSWISSAACSPPKLNWTSFRRWSSSADPVTWTMRRSQPSASWRKHQSWPSQALQHNRSTTSWWADCSRTNDPSAWPSPLL